MYNGEVDASVYVFPVASTPRNFSWGLAPPPPFGFPNPDSISVKNIYFSNTFFRPRLQNANVNPFSDPVCKIRTQCFNLSILTTKAKILTLLISDQNGSKSIPLGVTNT